MTLQWAKKHCQACFRSAGANLGPGPLTHPALSGGAFHGARQTKTPRGLDLRAACLSVLKGIADIRCEPEPGKRLHGPLVSRQSSCSARVTGCDPFFVPSQPGMA